MSAGDYARKFLPLEEAPLVAAETSFKAPKNRRHSSFLLSLESHLQDSHHSPAGISAAPPAAATVSRWTVSGELINFLSDTLNQ